MLALLLSLAVGIGYWRLMLPLQHHLGRLVAAPRAGRVPSSRCGPRHNLSACSSGDLALTLGLVLAGVGLPAFAQGLQPTELTLESVKRYADLDTPIGVTLVTQDGRQPVDGRPGPPRAPGRRQLVRRHGADDGRGRPRRGAQTLARDAHDNVFRASYAGDATYEPSRSGRYRARPQAS